MNKLHSILYRFITPNKEVVANEYFYDNVHQARAVVKDLTENLLDISEFATYESRSDVQFSNVDTYTFKYQDEECGEVYVDVFIKSKRHLDITPELLEQVSTYETWLRKRDNSPEPFNPWPNIVDCTKCDINMYVHDRDEDNANFDAMIIDWYTGGDIEEFIEFHDSLIVLDIQLPKVKEALSKYEEIRKYL